MSRFHNLKLVLTAWNEVVNDRYQSVQLLQNKSIYRRKKRSISIFFVDHLQSAKLATGKSCDHLQKQMEHKTECVKVT